MKAYKEKKKLSVDLAENGKVVLEKMKHKSYDLIFMDIQMPEMDGYEAALSIRQNEKKSGTHVPIIALTANASKEDKDKCIDSGMDDYLSKSVKSEKLYNFIDKFVS